MCLWARAWLSARTQCCPRAAHILHGNRGAAATHRARRSSATRARGGCPAAAVTHDRGRARSGSGAPRGLRIPRPPPSAAPVRRERWGGGWRRGGGGAGAEAALTGLVEAVVGAEPGARPLQGDPALAHRLPELPHRPGHLHGVPSKKRSEKKQKTKIWRPGTLGAKKKRTGQRWRGRGPRRGSAPRYLWR